jgi:hypothetical protein
MRFTLAACLALTAVVAVLCFLLTAKPSAISYVLMMAITIFAPVCAVGGIIYGRDNLRAFCIGAALPLALLVWGLSNQLQAISFDPVAYGWGQQQQQNSAQAYTTIYGLQNTGSTTGGISFTGGGSGFGGSGGTYRVVLQSTGSSAYDATLERAAAMKNPTCSLSIAAILCGGLMMAIRGGLKQKEAGSNATG